MSLLLELWPALLGVLGGIVGVFFHQKSKTAAAEKAIAVAKADQMEAQASASRADAIAAKTALTRVQVAADDRAAIDAAVAATPDVDAALRDEGFVK